MLVAVGRVRSFLAGGPGASVSWRREGRGVQYEGGDGGVPRGKRHEKKGMRISTLTR